MSDDAEENPIEQLLDLFLYAPVGMLYEYPDVLPKLIKRGKSQVQLAKFVGQLALKQQGGAQELAGGGADALASALAKVITEIGASIGLAPPRPSEEAESPAASAEPPTASATAERTVDDAQEDEDGREQPAPAQAPEPAAAPGIAKREPTQRLPIAKYDDLSAKEIIFLLGDLTSSQLERVRGYEQNNRNRKTVLAKIDRLLT